MHLIREDDVKSVLTMDICIKAVEEVYYQLGSGAGSTISRQNLWLVPPKSIKLSAGALPALGFMGVTAYTGGYGSKGSGPSTTLLYDSKDGRLLSFLESRFLAWYRTGATSAIASKFLANQDSETVAIIGSGRQAYTQALAIHTVFPKIREMNVYSPTRGHREAFADTLQNDLQLPVVAAESAESALREADIVATVTTSKEPVLRSNWLKEGAHVCAIGSHYPNAREVDSETVLTSKVVVDSREQALLEKGELLIPAREKSLDATSLIYAELGEIVAKKKPGRVSREERTLFCSGGLSIEQVGVAARAYEIAIKKGAGQLV